MTWSNYCLLCRGLAGSGGSFWVKETLIGPLIILLNEKKCVGQQGENYTTTVLLSINAGY